VQLVAVCGGVKGDGAEAHSVGLLRAYSPSPLPLRCRLKCILKSALPVQPHAHAEPVRAVTMGAPGVSQKVMEEVIGARRVDKIKTAIRAELVAMQTGAIDLKQALKRVSVLTVTLKWLREVVKDPSSPFVQALQNKEVFATEVELTERSIKAHNAQQMAMWGTPATVTEDMKKALDPYVFSDKPNVDGADYQQRAMTLVTYIARARNLTGSYSAFLVKIAEVSYSYTIEIAYWTRMVSGDVHAYNAAVGGKHDSAPSGALPLSGNAMSEAAV